MTIKKRLILSYILVFIVPILMTAVLMLSAVGGIYLFIKNGNHVYVESVAQFNHASEGVHHFVFRAIKNKGDVAEHYQWFVEILDPIQNYVVVQKDDTILYTYGNDKLKPLMTMVPENLPQIPNGKSGKRISTKADRGLYAYKEAQEIRGSWYTLTYVASQMPHGTDEAIEHVSAGLLIFLGLSFFVILILTVIFLSNFIIQHILPPLARLKAGADQISQGNLPVHVEHEEGDEFKPVVEAFNIMSTALDESLKVRTKQEENRKELVASISHDLRTPMTAIRAYVEGLLDNVADTPERRQRYLSVILKKSEQMDRLINQLFLFSKLELGDKALPLEAIDISHFVTQYALDNGERLERDGAMLTVRADTAVCIQGNLLLLERILENIVSNSIKYKTEPIVQITLSVAADDKQVTVTCADDGPGVSEEALPRLTELFYRTDVARSHTGNGSGLGMAIVARAMKLMKGDIALTLAKPHGLVVTLTFPRQEDK